MKKFYEVMDVVTELLHEVHVIGMDQGCEIAHAVQADKEYDREAYFDKISKAREVAREKIKSLLEEVK